jgi:hypothetical protein
MYKWNKATLYAHSVFLFRKQGTAARNLISASLYPSTYSTKTFFLCPSKPKELSNWKANLKSLVVGEPWLMV